MKNILMIFIYLILSSFILSASEEVPTKEEVSKLYVATFNRAPDSDGLDYWVNSRNKLSEIAQSFFDQTETQILYPGGTSNREFINSVYQNLFNRAPDIEGWDYWEVELNTESFTKNRFIEAVINGAKDNDVLILDNKNEVGLYFANQGLTDLDKAKTIMQNITKDNSSVNSAKELTKLYASSDAVKNLSSNYTQENIFSADILYPKGILKDNNENIYTYSSTDSGSTIAKLVDNKLELFLKTNSSISGLAYQKNQNRFIFTTSFSSLYSLDFQGNETMLKLFGINGNKITVASNDSFYTCNSVNGNGVTHYDKDGTKLEEIISNINICSSITLNNDESKLYYTSSFDGTINEVNLQTNQTTTIASNLGIPGTFEPITLAFDDNGYLFSVPAANGLYKYENGQFNSIIDSASGAGDIIYSKTHNSFLISSGADANIVAYNIQTLSSSNVTEKLNAFSIAQTGSGKILTCNNQMKVDQLDISGYSTYINLDTGCNSLITDKDGNTYIGTTNGQILKIHEDTQETILLAEHNSDLILHMSYDILNNSIISIFNIANNYVEIWSIPIDNPNAESKIYTLSDISVGGNSPVIISDTLGNAYILEISNNKIYRLNIQTKEFTEFYDAPLDSQAITVPDMVYLDSDDALLISTINDYQIIPIQTKEKSIFATNNGSVDNFSMHVNSNGEIIAVHSGQVFKMIKK